MIVRENYKGGTRRRGPDFPSGRTDKVVGVPGPAKCSSVWRWSMSLGERCRSRRACASARPTCLAPVPPNIKAIETRFGAPRIANFALATDSALWRSTHGPSPNCP